MPAGEPFERTARCWCAPASVMLPFAAGYLRCTACDTLVYCHAPEGAGAEHGDAATDLYGSRRWMDHQGDAGLPPIGERARSDLPERCLHWLRALLRYRRGPARLLEIGASHGGFLRLAQLAGFDALGLEMSPALVDLARGMFGVDMRLGPLEAERFADASFDVMVSFDVLEHLSQPEAWLREIRRVLRPDGVLLCQTPNFREPDAAKLYAANDPFLALLGGPWHLFLYSERSARAILERTGFPDVVFEPPIFPSDMFFIAATNLPPPLRWEEAARSLLTSPDGRVALALLDLYERDERLRTIAAERQSVIDGLSTACDERLALIEELDRRLRER